jgi:hypothetical protein
VQRQEIFSHHSVETTSGSHPDSYLIVPGVLFSEIKQSGREADHSLPFSAEVKGGRAIYPLPQTSSWQGA